MKSITIDIHPVRLLYVLILTLLSWQSTYGGVISYTQTFTENRLENRIIESITGDRYVFLSMEGTQYCSNPGEPNIPSKIINLLVPENANDFSIHVSDVKFKESVVLDALVYPCQRIQNLNKIDPLIFDEPFMSEYERDAKTIRPMILDDFYVNGESHIVTVAIPVAGYNGVSGELAACSSIEVDLHFTDGVKSKKNTLSQHGKAPSSIFDEDLLTLVVNPPEQRTYAATSSGPYTSLSTQYYYIITPKKFTASLSELISWKKQKGFCVIVATVEDILSTKGFTIGSSVDCVDKEACVRKWLKAQRNINGTFPLLIVGDEKSGAPVRKLMEYPPTDGSTALYNGDDMIPTDGYFSDLTSNYKLIKHKDDIHYTTMLDSTKYSPLLPVGRILANKDKHIKTYTKKALIYETDPGLGDASYLGVGLVSRQQQHLNYGSVLNQLPWITDSIILKDGCRHHFETNNPSGAQLIASMKNCGIISLMGHGNPLTIQCAGMNGTPIEISRFIQAQSSYEEAISVMKHSDPDNGIDLIHNEGKPSILYTLSCDTTPFDILNQKHDYYNTEYNMGSAFTVGGGYGGVAYIGNTRVGYDGPNKIMEQSFGSYIAGGNSIGIAVSRSARSALTYNPHLGRFAQFSRNLIGDPDIKIWQGTPSIGNVVMKDDGTNIIISGENLNSSTVSVYNGYSQSKAIKITSDVNSITVPKSEFGIPVTSSDYSVTILRDKFYPETKLFANNSAIRGQKKSYHFRSCDITSDNGNGIPLFVSNQGSLELYCSRNLKSERGFVVGNDGTIEIEAYGNVSLQSDVVSQGGHLVITSETLNLNSGFTIEKGATFQYQNK